MESILDIGLLVLDLIQPVMVGVVLRKHELRMDIISLWPTPGGRRQLEEPSAQLVVLGLGSHGANHAHIRLELLRLMAPSPSISEPHVRDDVKRCGLRTPVVRCHTEQELVRVIRLFTCLNKDIKVAIVLEGIRVDDVVLALLFAPLRILFDQLLVGESSLRVFVEVFHVRCIHTRLATHPDAAFLDQDSQWVGVLSRWKCASLILSP